MPPVPPSRGDPKRPHTGDEGDKPSKRARNSNGGEDAPDGDEEPASNIVHLSDRVRFSWQSKGKWKAKGSRSKSAPSRVPLDSSTPGSSSQPMSASAVESAPALVDPAIAEALSPGASLAAMVTERQPNEQELALQAEVARLRKELEDKNKVLWRLLPSLILLNLES
ncbi:hypothetical protein FRC12_005624 [Ceratobasidium sp. 428]|nr:hypothetical protein FRC12_005624 [Ceratobasidium sp. 428]